MNPVYRVILLALVVVLLAPAAGCKRRPAEVQRQAPTELAELVPLRGKPVIVHFWASWCPPCLPELPQIIEFATRVRDAGWTVLAVSTDRNPDEARSALPKGAGLPANLKLVFDTESRAAEAFGSYVFPETYWVDAEGRIVYKWVGPQDWARIAESGNLGAVFKAPARR